MNQKVLRKLLSREGHTTIMTDDGLQAVQQFEQHSPDFFDLVLLDMCMPVMDGMQACQKIREMERQRWVPHSATYSIAGTASPPLVAPPTSPPADSFVTYPSRTQVSPALAASPRPMSSTGVLSSSPVYPRIPIVAVTASALLEDKHVCVQAGMDDVIVKPLTPAALRHILKPIRARIQQNAAPPPLVFPPSAMQALQAAASAAEPNVAALSMESTTAASTAAASESHPSASGRPSMLRASSANAAYTPRGSQKLLPALPRAFSAAAALASPGIATMQPLPSLPPPASALASSPPPPHSSPLCSPPPLASAVSLPHASPPPPPQHTIALLASALDTTPTHSATTHT